MTFSPYRFKTFLPGVDDGYSLGSSSFRMRDGYFGHDVYSDGYVHGLGFKFADNSVMTTSSGGGGGGGGTITGSGTAGQVTYWNGSTSITGNNNLFWDNTNSRLGVGTSTTSNATLNIAGSGSTSLPSVYGLTNSTGGGLGTTVFSAVQSVAGHTVQSRWSSSTTSLQLGISHDIHLGLGPTSGVWNTFVSGDAGFITYDFGSLWFGANAFNGGPFIRLGADNDCYWITYDGSAWRNRFRLNNSSIVLNEDARDYDARIEGVSEQNLFFVDASTDRIGVGTNTPLAKLQINVTAADDGLYLKNTTGSGVSTINLESNGQPITTLGVSNSTGGYAAGSIAGDFVIDTNAATKISLATNNTVRMVVDGTGKVGIGTTTPTSALHILTGVSSLTIDSVSSVFTSGGSGGSFFGSTTTNAADINGAAIYTTAPTGVNNYHRSFGTSVSATQYYTNSVGGGTVTWEGIGAGVSKMAIATSNNIPLIIALNDAERFRFTSAGNFGIQTSSPGNPLTIAVDGSSGTPAISLGTTADSNTGIFHPAADTLAWSTGGTEAMRIDSSQRVGIGTTNPNSTIHTVGSVTHSITTLSTTTTLDATHYTVLVNANAGSVTINLPSATTITGRTYLIKKVDVSANTVVITPSAGQNIDGAATFTLSSQNESVILQNNGSNWFVF